MIIEESLVQFETNDDYPVHDYNWGQPLGFQGQPETFPCNRLRNETVQTGFQHTPGDILLPNTSSAAEGTAEAYLMLHAIREAIHGRVVKGVMINRSTLSPYWQSTSEFCAIKELNKDSIRNSRERNGTEDAMKELLAMQYLEDNRPLNLMYAMDILEDDHFIYIIMPYMDNGDLVDVITTHNEMIQREIGNTIGQGLPEERCRDYFRQILDGIGQMQQAGIWHRDLSLENITLDSRAGIKIIDWGQCLKVPFEGNQRQLVYCTEQCGKTYCMAPEVYKHTLGGGSGVYDAYAADMYSAAIILYIMAIGDYPWEKPDNLDRNFHLMSNGYFQEMMRRKNVGLSPNLMCLLERMFFENPRDRLSLAQVRQHPWMNP